MESNPYNTPSANLFGTTGTTVSEAVTQGTISQLQRTRPWVIFMAVMAFIGAGFMLVMAGIMVVAGAVGASASSGAAAGVQMGMMIGGAAFYGIMGLMYIYPGIKMWKYGARIGDLMRNRSAAELEAALNEQRVLWKFIGILTIVSIVMMIGFFVVAIAAGMSGIGAFNR